MQRQTTKPELLAPAGSFTALLAAVQAGADAVYFGGSAFHARALAQNFDRQELKRAILYAHLHGVKAYITVNTLLFDRELDRAVAYARFLHEAGADALICADLGLISRLNRECPTLPIHASTQAFVHSTEGANALCELGAERVVVARELPLCDIESIVKNSPAEVEMFLHGALCVCHSGQCLFSSAVGGRSGNRGLCAQPCRLPYGDDYALSLKDLALAPYVPQLIESGVASLKIEGRMKSPEYVFRVTSLYRRLLDENRGATKEEISELEAVFCRGDGFTDAYFTASPYTHMKGVRTEAQKQITREIEAQTFAPKTVPIKAKITILPKTPSKIELFLGDIHVSVEGDEPLEAQNAPLTEEGVISRVAKLGDSYFTLAKEDVTLLLGEQLFLPAGKLNALRRDATQMLEDYFTQPRQAQKPSIGKTTPTLKANPIEGHTAVFYQPHVLEKLDGETKSYFAVRYVPLEKWDKTKKDANGVVLPPVVFDSEWQDVTEKLRVAKEAGIRYVLVTGLTQINAVKKMGMVPMVDIRGNVTNRQTKDVLEGAGAHDILLSAELTLPQARDVGGRVLVYGRLPLMLLERCIIKDRTGCKTCDTPPLQDRTGAKFPVMRTYVHRNLLFNSLPTYMCDKRATLREAKLTKWHFLFTSEEAEEIARVVSCAKAGAMMRGKVKRFPTDKV